MKKYSTMKPALAALAFALALGAAARAQDSKGGETVVRERRATAPTTDATKTATEPKPAQANKNVDAPSSSAPSPTSSASPPVSSAASTKPVAAAGDEFEELKSQIASASNPAERGRLRQTLAARLAESGRKAEAVELLRSMLAEERFDPPFFYNTGNALARLGESNAAVEAYRKAISQRHGNYSRAQNNLGVVLMRLGRWDESEEALNNALKLENYTYAEASYSLGRLHALRGEAGLAIAEWQRTLRLDPGHADAVVALARALAEDGDPAQGLAVLDSFTSRAGKSGAPLPREVAVARGEIVAATNVAEEERGGRRPAEVVEAPRPSSASRSEGGSRPEKVSPDYPREARTSSKQLRPLVVGREAYSLLMSARDARADKHDEEAVALYRKAIEANGGYFAPANIELGYTLTGLHRNEEAAASLLVVLRKEGARYPVAYYHLGRIYEHLGRFPEAGDAFQRAAELMGETSP
jgi:tetratricopeptide (TPR) repeat protein